MHTQVAIIGGGLSGLALAQNLHNAGVNFQLFEARDRFGGRVKTHLREGAGFDLGPSWFWSGQQRMAALTHDLGLVIFDQYATGKLSFETETGEVVRNMGLASMQGSRRIDGGMIALIDGLESRLQSERLHKGMRVRALSRDGTITFSGGNTCSAEKIILAVPPRVAAELAFAPDLDASAISVLRDTPSWMAGQAKFIAIYDQPFWRGAGLSGDAVSRHGPLAEIHDASAAGAGSPAAIFGFLGVPASQRQDKEPAITEAALAQLTRIFGPQAGAPVETLYQDWAFDSRTATRLDHLPVSHHPAYGMPETLRSIWDGRLHFCSTEVSPEMGGYLEGALAAAEETARLLRRAHV